MIRTLSAFLEACYIIRRSVLSEESLVDLDAALTRFRHFRGIFKECGVRPDGMSLPRQHALDHYPRHIREFGAPNGLCSSITESKHIKAVKEPWRRSNRFQALGQMLITNQRLDKIHAARNNFEERGMLQGSLLSSVIETVMKDSDLTGASTDGDDDDSADVGEDGDAIEGSRVMATVVLANKPSKSQYLPLPYK